MTPSAAVDRSDFHAWQAYPALVDAETAARCAGGGLPLHREARGRAGVWIHRGLAEAIRIGVVTTMGLTWPNRRAVPIVGPDSPCGCGAVIRLVGPQLARSCQWSASRLEWDGNPAA